MCKAWCYGPTAKVLGLSVIKVSVWFSETLYRIKHHGEFKDTLIV